MADFKETLSQPQGLPTNVAPVASPSGKAATLDTIDSVLKIGFEAQDRVIKKEFNEDLKDVDRQETIFKQEADELRSQILSTEDKNQIDNVNAQLTSLERGKKAGKLSPAEASIRRNTIVKSAMNDNPWIAAELRTLSSIHTGGSGRGTAKKTPEEKALDKQREIAATVGLPLSVVREKAQRDFLAENTASVNKQAADAGTLTFPMHRKQINDMTDSGQAGIMAPLLVALKNDPKSINSPEWLGRVNNAKDNVRDRMIGLAAENAQKNVIFSKSHNDILESDITKGFAIVDEFIKSNDKLAYMERYRKTLAGIGLEQMVKQSPTFAKMVSMGLDVNKSWEFAHIDIPNALKSVEKHGSINDIRLAAEGGDVDAAQFLWLFENEKSFISEVTVEGLRSKKAPATPMQMFMRNLASGTLLNKTSDEPTSAGEKHILLNTVDFLSDPDSPFADLNWFLKPGVSQTINSDSALKARVKQRMEFKEAAATDQINEITQSEAVNTRALTGGLFFDERADKFRVKSFEKDNGRNLQGGRSSSSLQLFIDNLNVVYKVKKKYGFIDNIQDYTDEILVKALTIPEPKEKDQSPVIEDDDDE